MVITYLASEDHVTGDDRRLASCGRPSAFLRTALLGEDGSPVPVGEPGEICVAGPLLAGGYWKLPDETAETFRDGWMHTGDVAREDEDGFWYIVDRTKDMIVTGGFNVFPREVEDVVAEHPAVAQVGVIGTPDEKWGEAVTAIVVLREGHELTDEVVAEIKQMVKDRKGAVQAPKQVIATDALPLTGLGKPDKKALRATVLDGRASGWLAGTPPSPGTSSRRCVPELLLIGQLIDRSGMAWCISAFGREEMAQIAIEEWAGSSPIYTRRMQRALG